MVVVVAVPHKAFLADSGCCGAGIFTRAGAVRCLGDRAMSINKADLNGYNFGHDGTKPRCASSCNASKAAGA